MIVWVMRMDWDLEARRAAANVQLSSRLLARSPAKPAPASPHPSSDKDAVEVIGADAVVEIELVPVPTT